jgi:hypothetical protein
MFNKKSQDQSEQWVDDLVDCAAEAVQAYEDYLLDRIDHNKLAKAMKKLYNLLPPPEKQKAKKIEDRDYKEFFE